MDRWDKDKAKREQAEWDYREEQERLTITMTPEDLRKTIVLFAGIAEKQRNRR